MTKKELRKKIAKSVILGVLICPISCVVIPFMDRRPIVPDKNYYLSLSVGIAILTMWQIAYLVWQYSKKTPFKKATECNMYVTNALKDLVASYTEQIKSHLETTAWNLSNKIAEKWQNMDHYIQVLYASGTIDDEIKDILEKIRDNFARYSINGEHYDPEIWTPRGMETSPFWAEQRRLAKEALQLMSAKNRQKESIIQK